MNKYEELDKLNDNYIFELEVIDELLKLLKGVEKILKGLRRKIEKDIDDVLEMKISYREEHARSTDVEAFFERIENVMGYPRKEK